MSESKAFKDLTLSDNFMFGAVMQDKKICRLFLSEILKKDIVEIEFSKSEYSLGGFYNSQSVRLDIIATDSAGSIYDIEMQKTNKKDIEKRSRYYVSSIDKEFFTPGHRDYTKLKDCYVIFICTFDYVGKGYALYEKESCFNRDWSMPCDDGSHFMILNAAYDKEKSNIELPIEEFLSIIKGVEGSYSSTLAQSVSEKIIEVRQDQEMEVSYMTLDELIQDEKDEARAEGYSAGRESGLSDGLEQGLSKGLEQGRAEGFSAGRESGLSEGLANGLKQGRKSGLSDGIEQGLSKGLEQGRAEVLKNLGMSEEDYQKILQSASK